jgi:hypothetical protein
MLLKKTGSFPLFKVFLGSLERIPNIRGEAVPFLLWNAAPKRLPPDARIQRQENEHDFKRRTFLPNERAAAIHFRLVQSPRTFICIHLFEPS